MWGRTTARTPAIANAASMALPPSRSTSWPAAAANGWPAETAALIPRTSGRLVAGKTTSPRLSVPSARVPDRAGSADVPHPAEMRMQADRNAAGAAPELAGLAPTDTSRISRAPGWVLQVPVGGCRLVERSPHHSAAFHSPPPEREQKGSSFSKDRLASESESRANTTSIPMSWKPRLAPPQPEKKSKTFTPGPATTPEVSLRSLREFMSGRIPAE